MTSSKRHDPAAWTADLDLLQQAAIQVEAAPHPPHWSETGLHQVNPTLRAHPVAWRGLAPRLSAATPAAPPPPRPGDEVVLLWRSPWDGRVLARPAEP